MFRALLCSLLTISIVLSGCSPSGPASAPPKIVFQETTHDFGRTPQGAKVTHSYAFRNAGGLDLSIDNVRASCGCTVATAAGRSIPPGGAGSIDITLDTTHDSGRKTRTITVYSNDPAQPVTNLSLAGEVDAEVAADPPALYVGHVQRGQTPRNQVRLLVADATLLSGAESDGKVLDASLRTTGTGTSLSVTIKAAAPAGRFKNMVTVRTKGLRQPLVRIPVVGVVDSAVQSSRAAE
jgi:hypothetical protein